MSRRLPATLLLLWQLLAPSGIVWANVAPPPSVASTTNTQTSAQGERTNLGRLAGLYVTGEAGTLSAVAGRNAEPQNRGRTTASVSAAAYRHG